MAHPVVEGTAETAVSTAGTSHAITLPSGITSSDYVLIIMDIGSTSATLNALTDWTESLDEAVANGLKILRYTGTGVPSDPTFTSSASTRSASIAFRISGASRSTAPVIGTTATGTSATPNPPQVSAPSASTDCLFITFFGAAGEEADDDTWCDVAPTDYGPTPPLQKACGTAGTNLGGMIAAAHRQLTTSSVENPATFTKDVSSAWRAQTIRIDPPPPLGLPTTTDTALAIVPAGDYVRDYDGTDDNHACELGSSVVNFTHGTLAIWCHPDVSTGLRTLFSLHDSGDTNALQIYLDADEIGWWNGSALVVTNNANLFPNANRWYLVVIRKASGTTTPRVSRYDATAGTWAHANLNGTLASGSAPGSGGYIDASFAGGELWNGKFALRAVWTNDLPWSADSTGDAAIEAVGLEVDYPTWVDQTPDGLWKFNQASALVGIQDETGNGANGLSQTGTAVVADVPDGFSWEAGGGGTIALGQPSTTDTALGLTRNVVKTLGQPETTDTAQAITKVVTRSLGQPETTDVGLALTRNVVATLGQPASTDTALAVVRNVVQTLGQPSTTDEALAVTVSTADVIVLGLPETTDTPLGLTRNVVATLGQPSTSDTALAITVQAGDTIVLGLPQATDTALALTRNVVQVLGQPTVTDTPLALTKGVTRTLGLPVSTDATLTLTKTLTRVLGLPTSLDEALTITSEAEFVTIIALGAPQTIDQALAVLLRRGGRLWREDNLHQQRLGGTLARYDGATLRRGGALRRWTGTDFAPPREP